MVSKVSSILDQCRILAFPSTLFFVGERLVNHTIANINVIDRDTCEYRCYLNHNCVSVNFYFGPSEAGIQNCELNNSTKKKHDKDLTKAANYVSVCVPWNTSKDKLSFSNNFNSSKAQMEIFTFINAFIFVTVFTMLENYFQ